MERAAILAGCLLSLGLVGTAAHAASIPAYVTAAVNDSVRPDEDKKADANRKPAETLAFAGVKPGDKVVELAPGKGYYTRLLSALVGPKGIVYVVVRPPKDASAPPAPVQSIAADPHYSNVRVLSQNLAELTVPEPVDLVWTSQNYHDFHNIPNVRIESIDHAILSALRPGGTYLVLDHAAEAGSGTRDTNTLHRIDKQAVIQEVTAAGFELSGESNILSNKADPHTAKVFDPSIRGQTDQFILKFRKS
jgi:predicted methyltransferase